VLYRISNLIDESPRVRRFFLQPVHEEENTINFTPGQFIILQKELKDGEIPLQRSYSIANVETDVTEIELCIVINETGEFTPWLFSLNIGDEIQGSEPQGMFNLREVHPSVPYLFVCTGTGVAPFRSMIQKVLNESNNHVYLVFGNRIEEDILYREYWESLSDKQERFTFIPTLSRVSKWMGRTGYVHDIYRELLEKGEDARIYVCGWQEMCKETRTNLKSMGYNRRQYHFEQYD